MVRKNAPLACVHQPEGVKLTHRKHEGQLTARGGSMRGRHGQGGEREELKSRGPRGGIQTRKLMHGGSGNGNAGAEMQQHQVRSSALAKLLAGCACMGFGWEAQPTRKLNVGEGQSCGSVQLGIAPCVPLLLLLKRPLQNSSSIQYVTLI
jgi:hypothetical protein